MTEEQLRNWAQACSRMDLWSKADAMPKPRVSLVHQPNDLLLTSGADGEFWLICETPKGEQGAVNLRALGDASTHFVAWAQQQVDKANEGQHPRDQRRA